MSLMAGQAEIRAAKKADLSENPGKRRWKGLPPDTMSMAATPGGLSPMTAAGVSMMPVIEFTRKEPFSPPSIGATPGGEYVMYSPSST